MTGALIGVGELAKRLNVSENTVRSWVKQGHIPAHACFFIGPQIKRYDYDAIIAYLRQSPEKKSQPKEQLTLNFGDNAETTERAS